VHPAGSFLQIFVLLFLSNNFLIEFFTNANYQRQIWTGRFFANYHFKPVLLCTKPWIVFSCLYFQGLFVWFIFTGVGDYRFSVVMMYINAIVNGLQGVIVFVLYCVMNPGLRSKVSSSSTSSRSSKKSGTQFTAFTEKDARKSSTNSYQN